MVQVVTVHEIHVTTTPGKKKTATEAAVRPVTKVIKPGTAVSIGESGAPFGSLEEVEKLMARGAIRKWGDADAKVLVKNDKTLPAPDAGANGDDDDDSDDSGKSKRSAKRVSARSK